MPNSRKICGENGDPAPGGGLGVGDGAPGHPVDLRPLAEIADCTALGQAFACLDADKAMPLALVLALAGVVCSSAIGCALAAVDAIAMHRIIGTDGLATAASRWFGGKGCGGSKREYGSSGCKDSL